MESNKWWKSINEDIFFITPDVKRGIGIEDLLPNFHIICCTIDPIIPVIRKNRGKIFCLQETGVANFNKFNNSGRLLQHPLVLTYIRNNSHQAPYIMTFKPSVKLEFVIQKNGWKLIGNSAQLNKLFENKTQVYKILSKNYPQYILPAHITVLGNIDFNQIKRKFSLPFIIQLGHGWAGKTTFTINSEEEFNSLKKKFYNSKVKISKEINGLVVINNCCIYANSVLISPPAVQINGQTDLFDNPNVTCGRQWPADGFLTKDNINKIEMLSRNIGKLLTNYGYKGYFGIDFLISLDLKNIYILEINARLTASASFYTRLERKYYQIPLLGFHVLAFLNKKLTTAYLNDTNIIGSQLILRYPKFRQNALTIYTNGVYSREKPFNDFHALSGYNPQKLNKDQYIFLKRNLNDKLFSYGVELARIESLQAVIKPNMQLTDNYKNIIKILQAA